MSADHQNSILCGERPKYELACINCLAVGMTHTHKATDHLCPFFVERNNKNNIMSLLATICTRHLEGFENPFGLTKVHHSSSSSYDSSRVAWKHATKTGNYPTQFLADAAIVSSQSRGSSLQLAGSDDSLFHHVPDITASQAVRASIIDTQDPTLAL